MTSVIYRVKDDTIELKKFSYLGYDKKVEVKPSDIIKAKVAQFSFKGYRNESTREVYAT